MRGSNGFGFVVAVLLLCPTGVAFHGQVQGAEPTPEELKKEVAELRELLKYQGTWKRTEDGTKIIIEGEDWTWILPDGKINSTGKLKIVEVGKEKTKVDWIRLTGDDKGTTGKAIMHRSGEDTLQFRGAATITRPSSRRAPNSKGFRDSRPNHLPQPTGPTTDGLRSIRQAEATPGPQGQAVKRSAAGWERSGQR
jgi:hypothetical protein